MKKAKGIVLPELPQGIRIGERPVGIELQTRSNGVWVPVVTRLEKLPSTATIQMDISGLDKKKIISIKASIRLTAKKMGYKKQVKFAVQGNILHFWSN